MVEVWDESGENLIAYEHSILGDCHGVLFIRRGKNDPHVCVQPITEDDGNWFLSSNPFSSFWLPEYIRVMKWAQDWLEEECDKDPSGFGYVFRER